MIWIRLEPDSASLAFLVLKKSCLKTKKQGRFVCLAVSGFSCSLHSKTHSCKRFFTVRSIWVLCKEALFKELLEFTPHKWAFFVVCRNPGQCATKRPGQHEAKKGSKEELQTTFPCRTRFQHQPTPCAPLEVCEQLRYVILSSGKRPVSVRVVRG